MRSRIWSIPAIALYFYVATILMEHGFVSYFNIPSSFISASLSDNIIYFFQLLTASKYAAGQIGLLMWIVVIATILVVLYLYHSHHFWRTILGYTGTVLFFLALLWGSYGLGGFIALNSTAFWTPSINCNFLNGDRYIIPAVFDTQSVLVLIDGENKITGEFLVKNLSDLGCAIEYKNIGKIKK
jgi:hypothetical protein